MSNSDHFIQKTALDHARPEASEALGAERTPLVLVLENIRSGNNVGSILRTADSFALEEVLFVGYTPQPPHREILKTSLGAERSVPWRAVTDLHAALQEFKERGYSAAALEQTSHSTPLHEYDAKAHKGLVVILGNEVRGVPPDTLALVDQVLEIKQLGAKQSLNVSVATGVLCYHYWLSYNRK